MNAHESKLDYLDPKFEQFWEGDDAKEKELILDVAKVIRDFVEESAATRRAWNENYGRLQAAIARGDRLKGKDKERLSAYEQVFGDLPNRENKQFATRDVHRKSHGCFKARITIHRDLDQPYQKGLFVPGKEYDAVVRFSNGNPRNHDDYAPDARGMAIKFLDSGTLSKDVDLASISAPELNSKGLLDILTINFPVFFVDNPLVYAKVNSLFLANDQDILKSKKLDEILSVVVGGMSAIEQNLALKVNGSIIYNLLYQQWFSMAPSRLGEVSDPDRTAVKYLIEPSEGKKGDPEWPSWSTWEEGRNYQVPLADAAKIPRDVRRKLKGDRNYLRTHLDQTLSKGEFCMSLRLQPFISSGDTPIENSTQIWHWSEQEKADWLGDTLSLPFGTRRKQASERNWRTPVNLATIRIQHEGGQAANFQCCEDLSFNPWNNVPNAHKPLGIIQRVKRAAYDASRRARFEINQVPSHFEALQ